MFHSTFVFGFLTGNPVIDLTDDALDNADGVIVVGVKTLLDLGFTAPAGITDSAPVPALELLEKRDKGKWLEAHKVMLDVLSELETEFLGKGLGLHYFSVVRHHSVALEFCSHLFPFSCWLCLCGHALPDLATDQVPLQWGMVGTW